jgi:murein DD-endopeptidase MepM/ murein hydrolase activator NlpD
MSADMESKFRGPIVFVVVFVGLVSVLLAYALIKKRSLLSFKAEEPPVIISTMTARPNDNLALILKRDAALAMPDIVGIEKALTPVFKERFLRAGDNFTVITSTDKIFKKLIYSLSEIHSFEVTRSSMTGYTYAEVKEPTIWAQKHLTAEVQQNLYLDLLKAGYNEIFVANMVNNVADNIFAWRIDFLTEQRPGDRLEVLYEQEQMSKSGKLLNRGDNIRVLAAAYYGKGTKQKENYAYRYLIPGDKRPDYYDGDGNAVRKAFLRAPFRLGDSFRVSSRFSNRRFHPILRTYRPHHGTDYAAPYGTPASSIGKGKVIYSGWKSGFGNTVEVRHSSKYVSRYGHLSAMLVKVGQTVEQGQRVGRVGSTGLSTGPHLHFEMLDDGRQTDFLRMTFPSTSAVDKKYMDEFKQIRDDLIARMNSGEKTVQEAKKN